MIRNVLLLFMSAVWMMATSEMVVAKTVDVQVADEEKAGTVEGVVVDEEGKPLQGVHILVLKTYQVAWLDEQGHFFIGCR